MLFGSVLGIFEEVIPLIPIILTLSFYMGWDSLVGMGMSLLAAAFGFAAAIGNPFTIGLAQKLTGLPAFFGNLVSHYHFYHNLYYTSCLFDSLYEKNRKKPKRFSGL